MTLSRTLNQSPYLKIFYILFSLIIFSGCERERSEVELLKIKNEELKKELAKIQLQKTELKYLKNHSEVVIANTELKELKSTFNGEHYKLKIKLPKGYETGTATYPALYVLDAETNFGGISYIVQRLIKDQLIPPIIVIGIAYGTDYESFYKKRSRDLTPIEDKTLKKGGASQPDPTGGAGKFSDFLANELFPFVAENYRVETDERALYGHSYGGLFGSYILLHKPSMFNKYLLLSPSLWYFKNRMLDDVKNKPLELKSTKLYMASGELERRIDDLQTEFIALLENKKIEPLRIKAEVMKNETHRTIFGAGFTNGLRYLYAKPKELVIAPAKQKL